MWDTKNEKELVSLENVLREFIPEKEFEEVRRILYGNKAEVLIIPHEAKAIADKNDFEIQGYRIKASPEQSRKPHIVRIGAVQNSIKLPTTAPVQEQKEAIHEFLKEVAHAAHLCGVNVLCLQELFNCPFFVCTRERLPWMELAEDY